MAAPRLKYRLSGQEAAAKQSRSFPRPETHIPLAEGNGPAHPAPEVPAGLRGRSSPRGSRRLSGPPGTREHHVLPEVRARLAFFLEQSVGTKLLQKFPSESGLESAISRLLGYIYGFVTERG